MNVILNVDEAEAILGLVTSKVLDNIDLPEATRERIRDWRRRRVLGTAELDTFAAGLNEAIGNHLDERTTKMLRQRGRYVSEAETRLPEGAPVAGQPRSRASAAAPATGAAAPAPATPRRAARSGGDGR